MGKLAKIELHYEDGTITSLEGPDADAWLVACNAQTAHAYTHGFRFPVFTWKARRAFTEVSPGLFVGERHMSVFDQKPADPPSGAMSGTGKLRIKL